MVLLGHGQSAWNEENRFTGFVRPHGPQRGRYSRIAGGPVRLSWGAQLQFGPNEILCLIAGTAICTQARTPQLPVVFCSRTVSQNKLDQPERLSPRADLFC
jgi:hypothetical protein